MRLCSMVLDGAKTPAVAVGQQGVVRTALLEIVLITYDERLAAAARHNDVTVFAPRPKDQEGLGPEMAGTPNEEGQ